MSCDKPDDADATPPQPAPENPEAAATVASADLLQGHREVLIRHGDEIYRLRLTRNGKLILHK
jgi:hemin uptake protein HemP